MKDTVIWNIEQGTSLERPRNVAGAIAKRSALYQRTFEFFETYEYLVLPSVQVLPFSIDEPWVREINGKTMETYIDWMGLCYAITVTGHARRSRFPADSAGGACRWACRSWGGITTTSPCSSSPMPSSGRPGHGRRRPEIA